MKSTATWIIGAIVSAFALTTFAHPPHHRPPWHRHPHKKAQTEQVQKADQAGDRQEDSVRKRKGYRGPPQHRTAVSRFRGRR